MWWVQFSHPHTSNRQPADFAIDCNTHGSKGATGCDVTPIEFLTSCVQLVYWIGQVSAISANTGISFWQYYRMYVFKFSIHILTIIGMVIGISRYLYFNISYLSISLNFILLWCNTSYTQKMQLEGNWPNYSLPFLPCLAPFWRWGECWSGETCTPHVG